MRDTVRVARAACDDYRQWATDQSNNYDQYRLIFLKSTQRKP